MHKLITINPNFTKSVDFKIHIFNQDIYHAVVEVQTTWLSQPPPVPQHMSVKSSSFVQIRIPMAEHSSSASA